jgi:penicillin-binding protein 2
MKIPKRRRKSMSSSSFQNDTIERQGAFNRRIFMMGGVAAFGLFALGGRLMHLQFLKGREYGRLSEANQYNFRILPPPRGDIVDRNGVLIAGNRPSFRVMIMANEVKDIDQTLNELSFVLPKIAAARRRILRDINQNQRFVPTLVASDLNWEDFSKVSLYAAEIPGVVADMADIRTYVHGGSYAHVVGYVSKLSKKDLELEGDNPNPLLLHPGFRIGKSGLERTFDKELRGEAGASKVEVNANGQVIAEDKLGSKISKQGQTLTLSIDNDVQNAAIEAFGTDSGSAVMLDVHTGEIICMVSAPSFDPNLFVSGIPTKAYRLLADYERRPLLDKALGSTFAPGSTFKMASILSFLDAGIDPEERVVCRGGYQYGNRFFRCHSVHGSVNMREALKFSCDTYFYHNCNKAGVDRIAKTARALGLGQKFDSLELKSQKLGVIPDQDYKRRKFPKDPKWHGGETLSVAIGQGYVNISCLQLAVFTARLANGNKAVEPYLIKAIDGVDQVRTHIFNNLPIPLEHIKIVQEGMYMVSNQPNGTAYRNSQLGLGPIQMAGKTGTAQVRDYGSGPRKATQWNLKDHGLFVCYAPYDAPKYALAVIIQHGMGGSAYAAPKAREIMRTALIKDKAILKRIQTFDPNFNAALDPIGQASTGQAASSSSLSSQAPLIQE